MDEAIVEHLGPDRARAARVETLFIAPHSHTDIGYTDWQDACFRQLASFVPQVLDIVEETADFPAEARLRWVFEVTGPLLPWLRSASPTDVERLRHWNRTGAIEIAAMQYNLTPLLDTEQMVRSLYPVRMLREDYGLEVRTAMQDDVNGVSWRFAELLPEIGVDFLTVARKPDPRACATPAAGGLLVGLSSRRPAVVLERLPLQLRPLARPARGLGTRRRRRGTDPRSRRGGPVSARLPLRRGDPPGARRQRPSGPATARVRPPVERRGTRAAHRADDAVPIRDVLRSRFGTELPTWRGDWTDTLVRRRGVERDGDGGQPDHARAARGHRGDAGVGARGRRRWDAARAHGRHLRAGDPLRRAHVGRLLERGAPSSLFTLAQWNRKASYAYSAAMDTHEALVEAAGAVAPGLADPPPEGQFDFGDLPPDKILPPSGTSELLVINTLPFAREVEVEEPEPRAGSAPIRR
jgi:alpha-mannosidase